VLADVYSYPEDDMVVDPLLADHLAHFGIDVMSMKKVNLCQILTYCILMSSDALSLSVHSVFLF